MFATRVLRALVEMRPSSSRSAHHRSVHGVCASDPTFGWAVCLTAWQVGFALQARIGNRIRIVIAEPVARTQPGAPNDKLRTAAVRLAVEGYSAQRTIDLLSADLSRVLTRPGSSRAGLTILDLYESGYAETACLDAPSVIHLAHGHGATPRIKPAVLSTVESMTAVTGDGEAILAFSPSAARHFTADELSLVTAKTPIFFDPCQFRDDLLGLKGDRAPTLPAPPMAVLCRPRQR